jgi:hypothetical protein
MARRNETIYSSIGRLVQRNSTPRACNIYLPVLHPHALSRQSENVDVGSPTPTVSECPDLQLFAEKLWKKLRGDGSLNER